MKKHLFISFLIFFLASPTAFANIVYYNITPEKTVYQIEIDLQVVIDNANIHDTIVVTGNKPDADYVLTLGIPTNKAVKWQAVYLASANFASNTLIMFYGNGTFEVAGGTLRSPAAMTINSYGESATVIVGGGSVTATSENAIIVRGEHAKLIVTGGYVSNESVGNYPVIYMLSFAGNSGDVIISGTGKVEAKGGGTAISCSDNSKVKICENAQVSSFTSSANYSTAIFTNGNVEICDNATVSVMSGIAITCNHISVSGNSKIEAKEDAIGIQAKYVDVKDNAQVIAAHNHAITKLGSGYVKVDGGAVFAYGDTISDVINSLNIAYDPDFTGPTHFGIVLAWSNAMGNTTYEMFDTADIFISPDTATAYWDKKGTQAGISYVNGDNTGFIPLEASVLSVSEFAFQNIMVYPNPTTGEFRIENEELRVNGVEIFDVYGRKLLEQKAEGRKQKIDISNLQTGIYFVKITTEKGTVTKKIVKH